MRKPLCFFIVSAIAIGSLLSRGLFSDMALIRDQPAYAQEGPTREPEEDASTLPPGTVQIGPERQQAVGIRTGEVEKKPLAHHIRLLGTVAADETRVYFINATVDGWITRTYPNTTGSMVRKDQTLATFYSPEFLSAGQALLFAMGSVDRLKARPPSGVETVAQKDQITQFNINLQQYKDSLRNLGMGTLQIEEMIRTRRYMDNVHITSPADGFILVRNVSPGLRFEKGWEFYRIADLSRVWVLADVYEREAECFQPGVQAKVTLPYQKKRYEARISEVLPVFDAKTRTLKVRLEVDNPGFVLRPDMFVDVELPMNYAPMITVPEDAVLDSGFKKTVFVCRGDGFFEPREVETDRHIGNRVEIVGGLEPGEKIATSGNFLIDSESKMELAASGMYGSLGKDPVSGLEVSVNKALKAGRKCSYKGKSYYFSSGESRAQFEKEPEKYIRGKD